MSGDWAHLSMASQIFVEILRTIPQTKLRSAAHVAGAFPARNWQASSRKLTVLRFLDLFCRFCVEIPPQ